MGKAQDRVAAERDVADDAAARRWARQMREALEGDQVADDSGGLAARLSEERAKKNDQQ